MIEAARGSVDGVVFGRVDFTLSRGMARDAINDRSITDAVMRVAIACAEADLELVVGGSVIDRGDQRAARSPAHPPRPL
jgi:hypothetical protein